MRMVNPGSRSTCRKSYDAIRASHCSQLEAEHAGVRVLQPAFFDRHLQAGDIFFDVGAHFGLYAMGAATRLPGESV